MSELPLLARLRAQFPDSSARRIKQWLALGRVRVNATVVRDARTPTRDDDAVAVGPPAGSPSLSACLLHEDEALLVIEKPPGLLTIATERARGAHRVPAPQGVLGAGDPAPALHRPPPDRETSGLLVFAKSPAAKRHLQAQFAHRTAERALRRRRRGGGSRTRGPWRAASSRTGDSGSGARRPAARR
jgi:23S rRNA-/tRNA-specific pseudouridylate synthase